MPFFSPDFWWMVLASLIALSFGVPVLYLAYRTFSLKVFICASLAGAILFFVGLCYFYGSFGPTPPPSFKSLGMMPEELYDPENWEGRHVVSFDKVTVYHEAGHFPGVRGQDYKAYPSGTYYDIHGAKVVVKESSTWDTFSVIAPIGAGILAGLLYGANAVLFSYGPSLVSAFYEG